MYANSCCPLPSYVYEEWILPPYEEATLQFSYAFFQSQTPGVSSPSLKERSVCLAKGVLLMIPIVNWVVYVVLQYFSATIGGCFREAVVRGEDTRVAFYIDLGLDPSQLQDELLFQTQSEAVLRMLLKAGANPMAKCSTADQNFIERLVAQGKEEFLEKLVDEELIDSNLFLTQEAFLEAKLRNNTVFLTFLIERGYVGCDEDFKGLDLQIKGANELVTATFHRNSSTIDHLAKTLTFQEFCEAYKELRADYPHLYTGWIWNSLFQIPQKHFTSFKEMGKAKEVVQKPPVEASLTTLTKLFDRINFDDPNAPHYMSPKARRETLDKHKHVRSVKYLKQGLINICEKITGSKEDETGASLAEMGDHRRYLDWVIYYLQQNNPHGPLDSVKASVLIDLGKQGLVCSGRWKELFYECRCRLSGEKVPELTFEQQVMTHLGDLRSFIIYQLVHEQAHGCAHARDNLIFYLKALRGIPGDAPCAAFNREGIMFGTPVEAAQAFDLHYSPARQIAHMGELVRTPRKKGTEQAKDQDFPNRVYDYMGEQFAPQLQDQTLNKMREALIKVDKDNKLKSGVEANSFFQKFDKEFFVSPSTKPQVLKDYFNDYQKIIFNDLSRPLNEDFIGYALSEVVQPLVLGKLLVELGHLEWQDEDYFLGSFLNIHY